jgi:ATP phosphoribosyltransferase
VTKPQTVVCPLFPSTGNTLKANHLVEVEHIMDISLRLVVNQAALKLKQAPLRRMMDAFEAAVLA